MPNLRHIKQDLWSRDTQKEKHMLVLRSNTIGQHSILVLIEIADFLGSILWSQDVSDVYLQAVNNLKPNVYVKYPG